jgi:hypothetical protein
LKILVIPDCQIKPGVPLDHLPAAGRFAAAKKPDVIVNIGDFADMSSLCSYDMGKKQFEGRRYKDDIAIARQAMELFMTPILEEQSRLRKNKEKLWKPQLIFTLGNHEQRILKAVDSDAKLDGVLSMKDLGYEDFGWDVYPFLAPVVIGGVAFCHYYPSGQLGRPTTSARAILNKMHMSCIAGHQQGRDIAYGKRADGKEITAIIAGSFYQHDEAYLSPLTNKHWRGVYMLHEVTEGSFDEMAVSLRFLKEKYGKATVV